MKILYTKHALTKFQIFKNRGVKISQSNISKVIKLPENTDIELDKPKVVVSGRLSKNLILRVVYLRDNDINQGNNFLPGRERQILLK